MAEELSDNETAKKEFDLRLFVTPAPHDKKSYFDVGDTLKTVVLPCLLLRVPCPDTPSQRDAQGRSVPPNRKYSRTAEVFLLHNRGQELLAIPLVDDRQAALGLGLDLLFLLVQRVLLLSDHAVGGHEGLEGRRLVRGAGGRVVGDLQNPAHHVVRLGEGLPAAQNLLVRLEGLHHKVLPQRQHGGPPLDRLLHDLGVLAVQVGLRCHRGHGGRRASRHGGHRHRHGGHRRVHGRRRGHRGDRRVGSRALEGPEPREDPHVRRREGRGGRRALIRWRRRRRQRRARQHSGGARPLEPRRQPRGVAGRLRRRLDLLQRRRGVVLPPDQGGGVVLGNGRHGNPRVMEGSHHALRGAEAVGPHGLRGHAHCRGPPRGLGLGLGLHEGELLGLLGLPQPLPLAPLVVEPVLDLDLAELRAPVSLQALVLLAPHAALAEVQGDLLPRRHVRRGLLRELLLEVPELLGGEAVDLSRELLLGPALPRRRG
mmetsp:Transcript_4293/g.15369  ORF Transcript_4293/g.15369 Transcript_4293/m.15369 type:complete len:483 (+) Transcript_4293:876-2324(+)